MNNYFITRINALQAKPEFLNENNEDKEKALYAKGWNACNKEYIVNLLDIPAEDVYPVREGEWITPPKNRDYAHLVDFYECPFCGYIEDCLVNFCPNCGAKMTGGADE